MRESVLDDSASDGDVAGEGALFVDVLAESGAVRRFEA